MSGDSYTEVNHGMDVKPSNIGEESKSPVVSTTVCGDEVGSVMQDNVGSETGLTDIAGLAANDTAVVEMTSAILSKV